jgi:nicotinate-nucleotide adenylyltransferase
MYVSHIRSQLSERRFAHSVNVHDMCLKLCERFALDSETSDKVCVAGMLHDVMKERPPEELRMMVLESGLAPDPVELYEPKLWHAVAGAKYARDVLNIDDPDIINAIRFHTITRAGMSVVEKIVSISDWISVERDFSGVHELRELAFADLDKGVYSAIKRSMAKTLKKDGRIPAYTLNAYNYYNEKVSRV